MTNGTTAYDDLDETDLAILELIEADFDVSLETVAQKLDLSKSAVHYRVKKLKENGVIRGVTADVDPLALGLEMVAITDVSVSHQEGYSENIGEISWLSPELKKCTTRWVISISSQLAGCRRAIS